MGKTVIQSSHESGRGWCEQCRTERLNAAKGDLQSSQNRVKTRRPGDHWRCSSMHKELERLSAQVSSALVDGYVWPSPILATIYLVTPPIWLTHTLHKHCESSTGHPARGSLRFG